MTRQERAAALREQGRTYDQVAATLGVHKKTVRRWLIPDEAERDRLASRNRKRKRREPCIDCGKPKSYDRPDNERCAECQHEHEYGEENRRILELWNAGQTGEQIGAELNIPPEAVRERVNRWRQRNGTPISLHRRRNRADWIEIQTLWNEDGLTQAQIADRLGQKEANIAMKIRTMRLAGWDVERRGGGWRATA